MPNWMPLVLNHRQIKGSLPHIYVQHSSCSDQHDLLLERQDRMAQDFDSKQHTNALDIIPVGSEVLVLSMRQSDSKWIPGKVLLMDTGTNANRSYSIHLAHKKIVSHNRSMIRLNHTSYDLNTVTEVHNDAKVTPHPIRNDIKQQNAKGTINIKLKLKSPKNEGHVTTRSEHVVHKPLCYPNY